MAHAGVTVPSPLAGEGGSVLPHAMMGEGVVEEPLHSFEIVDTPLRPLPQGERARKATALRRHAFTIARAEPRAKPELWLFPVFVLFRPVLDGQIGRPARRRPRGFLVCIPPLTGHEKRRVVADRLLFFGYLQENTGPWGFAFARCRCRSASLPHPCRRGRG